MLSINLFRLRKFLKKYEKKVMKQAANLHFRCILAKQTLKQNKMNTLKNKKDFDSYNQKALNGTLEDKLNPIFILSDVKTELLVDILNGNIDLQELAKIEMTNRGLNNKGEWIGFKKNKGC